MKHLITSIVCVFLSLGVQAQASKKVERKIARLIQAMHKRNEKRFYRMVDAEAFYENLKVVGIEEEVALELDASRDIAGLCFVAFNPWKAKYRKIRLRDVELTYVSAEQQGSVEVYRYKWEVAAWHANDVFFYIEEDKVVLLISVSDKNRTAPRIVED